MALNLRLALLLALFMGISTTMDAQYKRRYKRSGSKLDIRYGIKFGYQTSSIIGDDFLLEVNADNEPINPKVEYSPLGGLHGGGYIDLMLTEGFHLQPEIHFAQLGGKMLRKVDIFNPENNYAVLEGPVNLDGLREIYVNWRLNYIQVPIIAKFDVAQNVNVNVGPVISWKISETPIYGDTPDSLLRLVELPSNLDPDLFQTIDYGGILGIGYQMPNGINLNVRYMRNFKNINKNEVSDLLATRPSNSISSIMFGIGMTFKHKERIQSGYGRRN